jgi:predicted acetyltransferase
VVGLLLDRPGRTPYLIAADGRIAGFVLLRETYAYDGTGRVIDVAEFFVLRKYRRQGVGEAAARAIFDGHRGRWQVAQIAANTPARAFWRKVIGRYTRGRFEGRAYDNERWRGPVQTFANDE